MYKEGRGRGDSGNWGDGPVLNLRFLTMLEEGVCDHTRVPSLPELWSSDS